MENNVKCPKCGSTQISAYKKGFSGTKAVAGAVVAGPIGLIAGTHGSGNIKITCLNCGHTFIPGSKPIVSRTPGKYDWIAWLITIVCIIALFVLIIIRFLK